MASPETLNIDAINATWAGASGAATDIDEPISGADGNLYGPGAEDDAADFGFADTGEIVDGDTITNISITVRLKKGGGAGNEQADVQLMVDGSPVGSPVGTGNLTTSFVDYGPLNDAGWNSDLTQAQVDSIEVRVIPTQSGMPGTNAVDIDCCDVVITFTSIVIRAFALASSSESSVAVVAAVTRALIASSISPSAVAVGLNVIVLQTGADFDGTNDWLGPLDTTGATNSKQLVLSGWVKPSGAQSATYIAEIDNAFFSIQFRAGDAGTNDLEIKGENTGGTLILSQRTGADIIADQWNHFLFHFDLGASIAQGYINDVAVTFDGGGTLTDDTIDFTNAIGLAVGSNSGGGNKYSGGIQELWLGFGHTLDISVEANRRKFISADGKPVFLGADGSLPISQPDVYLRDPYDSWETNYGSLGDFTENGELTDEGTKPALPITKDFATVVESESGVVVALVENKVLSTMSLSPSAMAVALAATRPFIASSLSPSAVAVILSRFKTFALLSSSPSASVVAIIRTVPWAAASSSSSFVSAVTTLTKIFALSSTSESAVSVAVAVNRALAASSVSDSAVAVALTIPVGGELREFIAVSTSTSSANVALAIARNIIAASNSESSVQVALAKLRAFAAASDSPSAVAVALARIVDLIAQSESSSSSQAEVTVTRAFALTGASTSAASVALAINRALVASSLSPSAAAVAFTVVVAGVDRTFVLVSASASEASAVWAITRSVIASSAGPSAVSVAPTYARSFVAASLSPSAVTASIVENLTFSAASLSLSAMTAVLVANRPLSASSISESAMAASISGFWFEGPAVTGSWEEEGSVSGSWTPEDPVSGSWEEEDGP